MIILDSICDFVRNLDRKEFTRLASFYVIFCVVVVVVIFVFHIMAMQDMMKKMKQLNKSRSVAQEILTKFQSVKMQKDKVDQDLKNNKSFHIQTFFKEMGTRIPAAKLVTPKFSSEKLANGYIQESLALNFLQIDTKQLCEILQDIEGQSLVYVKDVDISKVSQAKKINVNMSIATLRAE